MGTRADFYIGRGEDAKWLGSIAWDGFPGGILPSLLQATTKEEFLYRLDEFFANRKDVTLPQMGWPWPWNDSCTTDYAYSFDEEEVWIACFGHFWYRASEEEPNEEEFPELWEKRECIFPDMKDIKRVTFGKRSGLIVLGGEH